MPENGLVVTWILIKKPLTLTGCRYGKPDFSAWLLKSRVTGEGDSMWY